jgi:hypothetical protein
VWRKLLSWSRLLLLFFARKVEEVWNYQLHFALKNHGNARIDSFQLDLDFPAIFSSLSSAFISHERIDRRTPSRRFFQVTETNAANHIILPDDEKRVFLLDYGVTKEMLKDPATMRETFTVRLRQGDQAPKEWRYNISDYIKLNV